MAEPLPVATAAVAKSLMRSLGRTGGVLAPDEGTLRVEQRIMPEELE